MTKSIYEQIPEKIIREQELVIGPIAWSEARKVNGLEVVDGGAVSLTGDVKEIIDRLVARYESLFGRASHEVCREAVASLIAGMPTDQIPDSLR